MDTTQIWNEFSQRLKYFILGKVNNKEVAEDLLQEVFLRIHVHADSFDSRGKLSSWIFSITRNVIIDYYRKKKLPVDDLETRAIPEEDNEWEAQFVETRDFAKCMRPLLENLPDKYREALVKTSLEGVSQKELAMQEGLSYSATKSRVQRARTMVKDMMVACCNPQTDGYGNVISHEDKCTYECGCD